MTRLSVEFEWRLVGEVGPEEEKPELPAVPGRPSVYRLTFLGRQERQG
jgi:hypothetical protein